MRLVFNTQGQTSRLEKSFKPLKHGQLVSNNREFKQLTPTNRMFLRSLGFFQKKNE